MGIPVMQLEKNGLMFKDALAKLAAKDSNDLKKKKKEDKEDITGDLLDSVINMLSVLRKRF